MFFMTALKKNIFLIGAPSSGKTTAIKKLISRLEHPVNGFYTEEERLDGKRVGFAQRSGRVTTLTGFNLGLNLISMPFASTVLMIFVMVDKLQRRYNYLKEGVKLK